MLLQVVTSISANKIESHKSEKRFILMKIVDLYKWTLPCLLKHRCWSVGATRARSCRFHAHEAHFRFIFVPLERGGPPKDMVQLPKLRCSYCEYSNTTIKKFWHHIRLHELEYPCLMNNCSESFDSDFALLDHVLLQHLNGEVLQLLNFVNFCW